MSSWVLDCLPPRSLSFTLFSHLPPKLSRLHDCLSRNSFSSTFHSTATSFSLISRYRWLLNPSRTSTPSLSSYLFFLPHQMAHGVLVLWPRIEHEASAVKAWRQYPGRPPGSFPSDIVLALYFFIKRIPWAHVQISCSSFFKQGLCAKVPAWLNPTPPSLAGLTANSSLPFQWVLLLPPLPRPVTLSAPRWSLLTHSILFPSPALSQLATDDLDSYFIDKIETIRKQLLLAATTKFTKPAGLVPTSFVGQSPAPSYSQGSHSSRGLFCIIDFLLTSLFPWAYKQAIILPNLNLRKKSLDPTSPFSYRLLLSPFCSTILRLISLIFTAPFPPRMGSSSEPTFIRLQAILSTVARVSLKTLEASDAVYLLKTSHYLTPKTTCSLSPARWPLSLFITYPLPCPLCSSCTGLLRGPKRCHLCSQALFFSYALSLC